MFAGCKEAPMVCCAKLLLDATFIELALLWRCAIYEKIGLTLEPSAPYTSSAKGGTRIDTHGPASRPDRAARQHSARDAGSRMSSAFRKTWRLTRRAARRQFWYDIVAACVLGFEKGVKHIDICIMVHDGLVLKPRIRRRCHTDFCVS
jgi:hypothetical protein